VITRLTRRSIGGIWDFVISFFRLFLCFAIGVLWGFALGMERYGGFASTVIWQEEQGSVTGLADIYILQEVNCKVGSRVPGSRNKGKWQNTYMYATGKSFIIDRRKSLRTVFSAYV
jgi:hypothetical protein